MNKKRESLKGKGASIFLDNKEENTGTTEKHNASLSVLNNTITPDKQIKVTYFISDATADKLEEICFILKRKFKNKKVNKSKLVELAVNHLVEDWEENKEKSQIEEIIKTGI